MSTYRQAAKLIKAIAHPVRLRILNALRNDEECVCHLTALLRQRQAYVSQQLMFLREAGLIDDRKDGLRVYYRIKDPQVLAVLDSLNALAGIDHSALEAKRLPACPCPKCERQRIAGAGRKPCTCRSSVRVAPTA